MARAYRRVTGSTMRFAASGPAPDLEIEVMKFMAANSPVRVSPGRLQAVTVTATSAAAPVRLNARFPSKLRRIGET